MRPTRQLDGQWPQDVESAGCVTWVYGYFWLQQLCAEGVVEMRARAGEHNEADMGTKMVDLRRMTSLSMETALRPPMGWRSWVAMATLVTNAAAEDCRATTDLMNGEESRNGVETETSLVIALLKPRCEASTTKKNKAQRVTTWSQARRYSTVCWTLVWMVGQRR